MIRGPFLQHKATNSEASVCVKWTSWPLHRRAVHPSVVCFFILHLCAKQGEVRLESKAQFWACHFGSAPNNGHHQTGLAGPFGAIKRHGPPFFDHVVSATMAPLNSDESEFALYASADLPKLHSAPL